MEIRISYRSNHVLLSDESISQFTFPLSCLYSLVFFFFFLTFAVVGLPSFFYSLLKDAAL